MSRVSQSFFFGNHIFEHIDVTPRYRRVDCDQPLQVFVSINIRCLLDLSEEVEVIPGDDAVPHLSPPGGGTVEC